MTENNTTRHDDRTARTLGELSHTHPYTGRVFGDTQTYERGRVVAADGGEREAEADEETTETMKDVDHTPRKDSEGVNHVYDTDTPRDDEDE